MRLAQKADFVFADVIMCCHFAITLMEDEIENAKKSRFYDLLCFACCRHVSFARFCRGQRYGRFC